MNERIEELILAYLHRGSTPEQERELFEACKSDPATSAMLRQHLILSLKLRQLRDEAAVPPDVHNALLRRINETVVDEAPVPAAPAAPPRRRFGWVHMFGASLGTAAAGLAMIVLLWPSTPAPQTATVMVRDTVRLATTDTVFQVRTVRVPATIAQQRPAPQMPGTSAQDAAPGMAQTVPDAPAPVPSAVPADDVAALPAQSPAMADARPQPTFLEQYNTMLVAVEKVRLTSEDRVRF